MRRTQKSRVQIKEKRVLKIVNLITMLMFIAGCASTKAYTPPQTVEGVRSLYTQFNRVFTIKHNILVANSSLCSRQITDYGFIYMFVNEEASKEQQELAIEAFNLQKEPMVTYVTPKGAAYRAGLLAGDVIVSVNDNLWSDAESDDVFKKLLKEGIQSPNLRLGILRDKSKHTSNLTPDMACDYSFMLVDSEKHSARAYKREIAVDFGAAKLLKRDDEIAFLVAHELAHLLLGHTLPERIKELDEYKMRNIMEKDADALGIRLMISAGYDPKGAETALRSTDLLDSGPITRFLNYHGPYMLVDERILYLRNVLGE